MNKSMRRITAVPLLAFNTAVIGCYSTSSYTGDGVVHDFGSASGMRYALELPPVDINKSQCTTFSFSGAPPEWLQGYLAIQEGHENVVANGSRICVELVSADNITLKKREGVFPDDWPPSRLGRYNFALGFFSYKFDASASYNVVITVDSANQAESVLAVPVFYGGGIRLP